MKRKPRLILAALLGFIIFIAGMYFIFFLQLVKVPTGSMANTIIPGDRVAVNLLYGEIKRGDIVVFKYPEDLSVRYVSRVLGLPGETIQVKEQTVFINGVPLAERRVFVILDIKPQPLKEVSAEGAGAYSVYWAKREENASDFEDLFSLPFASQSPFKIPEGHYFMMGDNRDNSQDSRFYGPVPAENLVGKASWVYWSNQTSLEQGDGNVRWDRLFTKLK